jgi:hypothetical protein
VQTSSEREGIPLPRVWLATGTCCCYIDWGFENNVSLYILGRF